MKILLIWLCTTAAFDDCEVHALSNPIPAKQCETAAATYREILGPELNYRLICEDATVLD